MTNQTKQYYFIEKLSSLQLQRLPEQFNSNGHLLVRFPSVLFLLNGDLGKLYLFTSQFPFNFVLEFPNEGTWFGKWFGLASVHQIREWSVTWRDPKRSLECYARAWIISDALMTLHLTEFNWLRCTRCDSSVFWSSRWPHAVELNTIWLDEHNDLARTASFKNHFLTKRKTNIRATINKYGICIRIAIKTVQHFECIFCFTLQKCNLKRNKFNVHYVSRQPNRQPQRGDYMYRH